MLPLILTRTDFIPFYSRVRDFHTLCILLRNGQRGSSLCAHDALLLQKVVDCHTERVLFTFFPPLKAQQQSSSSVENSIMARGDRRAIGSLSLPVIRPRRADSICAYSR